MLQQDMERSLVMGNLMQAAHTEGIGHCILGYADGEEPEAAPRKDNYVYYIE